MYYKSEKISFDKAFYGKPWIWSKVAFFYFVFFATLILVLVWDSYTIKSSTLYNMGVSIFFLAILGYQLMQGYKVTFGANNNGAYSIFRGLIPWKNIKDVEVKACGWGKKQKCLYLKIKKGDKRKIFILLTKLWLMSL